LFNVRHRFRLRFQARGRFGLIERRIGGGYQRVAHHGNVVVADHFLAREI